MSAHGLAPRDPAEALALQERLTLAELVARAGRVRDRGFAQQLTYSPKVFIPLTRLCRDVCHYCTFAKTPRALKAPCPPHHRPRRPPIHKGTDTSRR